jgi:E3 ubiquitin-protein ligase BIG BROTHER and related proteins
LDEAYRNQNHISGAGPPSPSDYSQTQYYQGESSTGAAATSGMDEQIASDFEYAKQLQAEMEGLSVEDDGMTFCSSSSNRTVSIHIS